MGLRPRILVLDNRDSFTFNVVQALREAGAATGVVEAGTALPGRMRLDGLVISPGPGHPDDAPASMDALRRWEGRIPVWGICLGHQCLAVLQGARLVRAARILHGKTCRVDHDGQGLFTGLPARLDVMRYHSLLVEEATLPATLEVTARTAEGEIMGLRCRRSGAEGVQFHPESVAGTAARAMFASFVERCAHGPALLQTGENT